MILLDPDLDPDPAPADLPTTRRGAVVPKKSIALTGTSDQRRPSQRALARFLTIAQKAVRLKGQVNVLLTTDPAIRRLNRQFRGKNKATDVLSFPADGIGAEELAGDLAISVPTARRQATGQGHALATEIKVLMLHGLLHLAGYDHEADTGQMARREQTLRARLGLPQGLIERVSNNGKQSIPTKKLSVPSLRRNSAGSVGKQDPDPTTKPVPRVSSLRPGKPRTSTQPTKTRRSARP